MTRGDVPGSSRRCEECKRRRKKCDLTEPHCLRCRRSGIACSGPTRSRIFVSQAVQPRTQRSALARAYEHRRLDTSWSRDFYHATLEEMHRLYALMAQSHFHSRLPRRSAILSTQVAKASLYASLLDEFGLQSTGLFSADRVATTALQHYSTVATIIRGLLPLAHVTSSLLDMVLSTLLASYYGSLHGHKRLVASAQEDYVQILGHHRGRIAGMQSATQQHAEEAARSFWISSAMLVFEQLNSNDMFDAACLTHTAGTLLLLQICGPQWVRDTPGAQLVFSGIRGVVVHLDLHLRRPSSLSQIEWLQVPFEGRAKTKRELLHDIGFSLSSTVQASDQLLARMSRDTTCETLHLLLQFRKLQEALNSWLVSLESTVDGPLILDRAECDPQALRDVICIPNFETSFHQRAFPTGTIAGLLVHYWSFHLLLLMTAIDLEKKLLTLTASRYVQLVIGADSGMHCLAAEQNAISILEAVPYLSSCYEGVLTLKAPLEIVSAYYKAR